MTATHCSIEPWASWLKRLKIKKSRSYFGVAVRLHFNFYKRLDERGGCSKCPCTSRGTDRNTP